MTSSINGPRERYISVFDTNPAEQNSLRLCLCVQKGSRSEQTQNSSDVSVSPDVAGSASVSFDYTSSQNSRDISPSFSFDGRSYDTDLNCGECHQNSSDISVSFDPRDKLSSLWNYQGDAGLWNYQGAIGDLTKERSEFDDLYQVETQKKIAEFKVLDPGSVCHIAAMDDIALAILNKNELQAIQKIGGFVEAGDTKVLIKSLKNEYVFLTDWIIERKLTDVIEVLEMCTKEDDQLEGIFAQFVKPKTASLEASVGCKFDFVGSQWHDWNENSIVNVLTKRDVSLVKAIKWEEIEDWLKSGSEQMPFFDLEKAYLETMDWIGFQITNEKDEDKRRRTFDKFIKMGMIFLENKNLHGASQVALALDVVCCDLPKLKNQFQDYPKLVELSNLKTHAKYIDDVHILEDANQLLLPISHVFWFELQSSYKQELRQPSEIDKYKCILENFEKPIFQTQEINTHICHMEEICRLAGIKEHMIEEYASLCRHWNFPFDINIDIVKSLREWNPIEFAEFLIKEMPDFSLIKEMHEQGINTGKGFIKVFSDNGTLIDNWPVKTQCIIWKHYLKYILMQKGVF